MLLLKQSHARVQFGNIYQNAGFETNPLVSFLVPPHRELVSRASSDVFQPIADIFAFASGSKSARQMGSGPAAEIAGEGGFDSWAFVVAGGNVLMAASAPADTMTSLLVKGTRNLLVRL